VFSRNKAAFLAGLIFSLTLLVPHAAASLTPVASFTYTPARPILGDTVVFNASASYDPDGGTIKSYSWDFDDGTTKTWPDPVIHHNYTAFRTYNVTLSVTDDKGEKGTTWQSVTVRQYPVARFTYTPDRPIASYQVTFNASLSTAEGGTIVNYKWTFGDTNVTTVTNPVINHVYKTPGTYTVILNVTDSEDLWDTESQLLAVRGIPVARFTYTPARPIKDEPVTFDASLSTPNGGTIVSYFWNFGDLTNGTGMIVNHTYTAIGDYTVTLTITDSEDLTNTTQATFKVRDYPVAFFEYKPKLPLVNETVTFNATLSTADGGTIVSYTWNFGDGSSPVTEADPITNHVYTAFGTYNVTLTIVDSEDLNDTFMDTIRILIHPVANFTHLPIEPIVNGTITFDASASYDPDRSIVSYTWKFGDGNTTVNGAVITHVYKAEDVYNVTLTVTDDDGLTDTVWKLVWVYTEIPVHDVAIITITTSATEVYPGRTVNITVVAKNEGTAYESFNVTIYYNAISLGTEKVSLLPPGGEKTLKFSWNTAGVTPAIYNVTAKASVVPRETLPDQADNTKFLNVKVKGLGDVDGSGKVEWGDLGALGLAYGSTPGALNWNPEADFDASGKVDWGDLGTLGLNYGRRYY